MNVVVLEVVAVAASSKTTVTVVSSRTTVTTVARGAVPFSDLPLDLETAMPTQLVLDDAF